MRPPILQSKIMLLLLAVVVAGVSLGSALHSPGNLRVFYGRGINWPRSGGWTGYVPHGKPHLRCTTTGKTDRSCLRIVIVGGRTPSLQERRQMCSALRYTLSHRNRNPFIHRSDLRMQLRFMCHNLPSR